jgi:RNA polymerase sigma factor (sigma-70 family)
VSKLNSRELLQLYVAGESDAATAIFDRYAERLIALTRSRMAPKLRSRLDPQDVVQSAYLSFFVHAKENEYELAEPGDLWRLLASITLHKLYGQVEKHSAAKRSIECDVPIDLSAKNISARDPLPVEVVAAAEVMHLVINSLGDDEKTILTLCLNGYSNDQIAAAIGKSERTVRRAFADVKRTIEQKLLRSNSTHAVERSFGIDLQSPLQYSDYALEQLLGSGGMGKVFRAREKSTGRQVAIKTLHKVRQSDERAVARFVQEAEILSKMDHPNIVKVRGLGQFPGGGYFLSMDLIDGVDLQSRLKIGAFSTAEAIRIITLVASAIQYAHDQGVLHCDIKPGNILLDKHNQVFVTDFGFAFLIANGSSSAASFLGGTAEYIAPEILRGHSRPTPAADIYALGTLLWTLATGALPNDESLIPTTDENYANLWSICSRCRATDPTERFQSATQFISALSRRELEE